MKTYKEKADEEEMDTFEEIMRAALALPQVPGQC